jgi:hypothetical protein
MFKSADPGPDPAQGPDANARTTTEGSPLAGGDSQDNAARAYRSAIPRWICERSRYFWLSLTIGLIAASVASFSFTDPWPSNVGGFVFVVAVVTALLREAIALVLAFMTGWREAERPTARQV